jgi:protein CpxP
MKKAITTVSLVSGLLLAGIGSYATAQGAAPAQQGQMQGHMQGHPEGHPGAEHGRRGDPVAATQKRLGQLKQKLNLKPAQQASWDTYANAMTAQARARAQAHEQMKGMGGRDHENMSTPEKMEKMAAMMRVGADSLSKSAADTKVFYDGLSVEQRTIFDLYARNAWNSRMQHGHHDMH